ncbi:trimeric intracellular cation channel family protein [Flavobacterium sp. NKUCC04_CG]|uniref:trimeric intracellular cation channel family protein n=1 Tax=Flavobacterium sp. NKUCC04_CG TaxID=2842121 RepID=UPI001C5AFEC7|nr:trimeric intracellular cation channel family protein [Flavobacterium sp. NKUCC04_CG]MBW3517986.1 trimeric intracellular cation channel family protein [Flavobacterium sp. NKUCC04_CG]
MFEFLDLLGTMAFAVSGALVAMEKRLDLFGILSLSFVTAIGGGTLRDVVIGISPVSWLTDLNYFFTIIAGTILAIIFRKKFAFLRMSLLLFDTIGLAIFTLIGIEKGMGVGLHPIICITLGTITACFGGVIRDILGNDIPVIFRKEIYATVCIVGGLVYYALFYLHVAKDVNYLVTSGAIVAIRILAVVKKWSLPQVKMPA